MRNVASLAGHAMRDPQAYRDTAEEAAEGSLQAVSLVIRKLFMLLHGSYGSLFTSKFATGQMAGKHDKGTISAMKVWDAKLSRFSGVVVEAAAARLAAEHPGFPPNLPQFELMCDAAMPRQTYAQQQGLPALPAPMAAPSVKVNLQERNDGKDWARRIVARMEQGDTSISMYSGKSARMALGLEVKV